MSITPGPWKVDGLLIKAIDHGKWFGIAKAGGTRLTIEGNMANARLIAAAPTLLERLEDCAGVLQSLEDQLQGKSFAVTDALANARAAITAAKGEQ